jgi:hypothetical protein
LYADLLRRERQRDARARVVQNAPPERQVGENPAPEIVRKTGHFRRSTRLLDALEAGEVVTVGAWQLGSREVRVPDPMKPGNCPNVWWTVTPDDVVEQTVSPVVDRPRGVAAVDP